MRGLLAGLLVALIVATVALLVATVGSLGVAAIGWLLHQWFDLTQWQGTIVALVVTLGLGYLVYRLAVLSPTPSTWSGEYEEWDEPDANADEPLDESGVVPWRRSRSSQGETPAAKRQSSKRK